MLIKLEHILTPKTLEHHFIRDFLEGVLWYESDTIDGQYDISDIEHETLKAIILHCLKAFHSCDDPDGHEYAMAFCGQENEWGGCKPPYYNQLFIQDNLIYIE